jgi:hypothetical protein
MFMKNNYRVYEAGEDITFECGCVARQTKTSFTPCAWLTNPCGTVNCVVAVAALQRIQMSLGFKGLFDEQRHRPQLFNYHYHWDNGARRR